MQSMNRAGEKDWKTVGNVALAVVLLMVSGMAMADPLSNGICGFVGIITGRALFGSVILATAAAGMGVLFGGEMNDMIKKIVTFLFICGCIFAVSAVLSAAFTKFGGVAACA